MSATSKKIRTTRGASRKQYAVIACGKEKRKFGDGCAAVEARQSESDLTRRGFSRGARMWHRYTDGGEPICDVCKRVGHVAKSCWRRKASLNVRRSCCGDNVLHSVVSKKVGFASVKRHISVSVNTQRVEALLDFNAMENAVSYESVKVDPKLKIYDFDRANSEWRLGARGMVWLPVVIGSRSDKLRCVVVEGLTEKLIIGLPGLSYLGASIDFATGDVRIGRRGRKKVKGNTMAKKSDELHEDHALVRDAKTKCKESKDTVVSKDVSRKKSPEGSDDKRKECTKGQLSEQVKDLAVKDEELRDVDRVKVPNQKNDGDPVSGRGRKEGKVNVVSPKQDKLKSTITTTTITPDHKDEKSEGECEDSSDSEELETCSAGCAKTSKNTRKAKRKKGKKKKKGRGKR